MDLGIPKKSLESVKRGTLGGDRKRRVEDLASRIHRQEASPLRVVRNSDQEDMRLKILDLNFGRDTSIQRHRLTEHPKNVRSRGKSFEAARLRKNPMASSKREWYNESKKEPFRVAVCYWGATRTLRLVFETHEKHVFAPLQAHSYESHTFLHNWYSASGRQFVWKSDVSTSNENPEDWKIAKPLHSQLDDQDAFLLTLNLSKYYYEGEESRRSAWNIQLLRNHLLSLESLKRVSLMVINSNKHYDAVIYLRPDLEITRDLPVERLRHLENNDVIIPFENHFLGYNDRFAMGRLPHMLVYGLRINEAEVYREVHGRIISEKFNRYILDKYRSNVIRDNSIQFEIKRWDDTTEKIDEKDKSRGK